jgi:hypothetical protein
MPTLVYKGVGVNTHHYPTDLRTTGITARNPGAVMNEVAVQQHIARGTTFSPCISLTKSFGIASDYARNFGFAAPTKARPAYVYELQVPDMPGRAVIDPIVFIGSKHPNPLVSPSYHHDGDQDFLGFVAYPKAHVGIVPHAPRPPGMTGSGTYPVNKSIELETLIFAIRDAEVLVHKNIPSSWFTSVRHDIF